MSGEGYTPSTAEVQYWYCYDRLVHDGMVASAVEESTDGDIAAFQRWLASERARIWDEGFGAGQDIGRWPELLPLSNPYDGTVYSKFGAE